ncbi:MAG: hypothetical protein ABR543_19360 [Gemmatimonadaceae bacterium]
MRTSFFLAALVAFDSMACDAFGPHSCPLSVNPAVTIAIRDAATGVPAAIGAVATARNATMVDTLAGFDSLTVTSRRAGPGTYRVEVRKAGYLNWVAEGVHVGSIGGACPTMQTVHLEAALDPAD